MDELEDCLGIHQSHINSEVENTLNKADERFKAFLCAFYDSFYYFMSILAVLIFYAGPFGRHQICNQRLQFSIFAISTHADLPRTAPMEHCTTSAVFTNFFPN